jgi:cyclophilin family peptidyl-prolyl cis-trans isomerase
MADADCIRVRIDYETAGHSGYMLLDLHPSWAPFSCERFLKWVDSEFLDGQRFCRAIEGFVLDWNYGPCAGASDASDPHSQIYNEMPWAKPREVDAAGKLQKNLAGRISFGQEDDGSTKTEVFINLVDNSARLDSLGFVPFGEVVGTTGPCLDAWEGGRRSDFNFSHGDIFFAGGATREKAEVEMGTKLVSGRCWGWRSKKSISRDAGILVFSSSFFWVSPQVNGGLLAYCNFLAMEVKTLLRIDRWILCAGCLRLAKL